MRWQQRQTQMITELNEGDKRRLKANAEVKKNDKKGKNLIQFN